MSFYRSFIAAVGAMGLATVVFAADQHASVAQPGAEGAKQAAPIEAVAPMQLAEAQSMSSSTETAPSGSAEGSKVNVNTATAKELMQVKGVSAAKAKAIVSYRKKHGEFKSLEDLKQVRGFKRMNEKTLKEVQDQLTLG